MICALAENNDKEHTTPRIFLTTFGLNTVIMLAFQFSLGDGLFLQRPIGFIFVLHTEQYTYMLVLSRGTKIT